jgi:CHAT domain-containing protein
VEWIERDSEGLRQEIIDFRRGLESYFDPFDPTLAQGVYDQLIRPFEANLVKNRVDTLVFVQDGILRSIPMAALHDGNKFPIEKYALATTPTLTLTAPEVSDPKTFRALAVGLTEGVQLDNLSLAPLPYVGQEVRTVAREFPGSRELLNDSFSRDRLRQELQQEAFPILHVATHGQFGAEP